MLATDKDAFMCDMVETYHIFDYKALPVETLAALAFGLRETSRIKLKLAGINEIPIQILLPQIYDILAAIGAGLSGNAAPPSMFGIASGKEPKTENNSKTVLFNSGEDFQKEWKRRTGVKNG